MKINEIREKMRSSNKQYKQNNNLSLDIFNTGIDIWDPTKGFMGEFIKLEDKTAVKLRNWLCELYGKPQEKK